MEFVQAQPENLGELIDFIIEEKEQELETDYIPDNIRNFYIVRENREIVVCGSHVETLFPRAEEIRGVVTRPKNGIRTKQINNFLCDIIRKQGNIAAYAVINPEKEGMKKYIEFLKIANKFREVFRVPSIKMVIPRYKFADYGNRVLLQRSLYD